MDLRKSLMTVVALAASVSVSAANNTSSQPSTFLGPTAHFGVVKSLSDDSAFALAVEAGPKNYRGSGTIGWEFDYNQRMKATAEYLAQKLSYAFNDGNESVWMGQSAVGLNYQYDFRQVDPFNTLLDLSAYYSHSPSKGLGTGTVTTGSTTLPINKQVAGANAFGVGPGISFVSLYGGSAGLELNYDNVHYNTKYRPALTVKGVGGTLRLSQALTDDIKVGGAAAFRKPYNNYEGSITFSNLEYYGIWSLSGFGAYTIGKSTMPSSYNVGLGADYFIDASNRIEPPAPQSMPHPSKSYKDFKDYKDMPPIVWKDPDVVDSDLLNWVSVPAVRIPQVYGVPDQACAVPRFSGSIPGGTKPGNQNFVVDLSDYFSPSALVFNVTQNGVPMVPGVDYTVVGTTLTFIADASSHPNVVVTGSNGCGLASSNTFTFDFD